MEMLQRIISLINKKMKLLHLYFLDINMLQYNFYILIHRNMNELISRSISFSCTYKTIRTYILVLSLFAVYVNGMPA